MRAHNVYVCPCGYSTRSYAAMERHQDAEHDGHGRITVIPVPAQP